MKQTILYEKYPKFTLKVDKNETPLGDVDAVISYLKKRIGEHESATFIAVFDHLLHTRSLPDGQFHPALRAAKNIVFCFGLTIPDARVLAVRPRPIGVAETDDAFILTFMEAPMPVANSAMESWAHALPDTPPHTRRAGAAKRTEARV